MSLTWTEVRPAGDVDKQWRVASDASGDRLCAVAYRGRVYTSSDGGANWTERRPAGDADRNWMGIVMSSDGSHLVAIGGNYTRSYYADGRVYTSDDYGVSWTERQPIGDYDVLWRSVACSADGSRVILVSEYQSAVGDPAGSFLFLSTDYGASWTRISVDGDSYEYYDWDACASSVDGSTLVAATTGGYLFISHDGGDTWIPTDGATAESARGYTTVIINDDGSVLVVGVEDYGGNAGGLHQSSDGGISWSDARPIGETATGWIVVASGRDGEIRIIGRGIGPIITFYSDNNGDTWETIHPAGVLGEGVSSGAMNADGSKMIVCAQSRLYILGVSVPIAPFTRSFPWVGRFQLTRVL